MTTRLLPLAVVAALAIGCGGPSAIERIVEARRLSAELRQEFTSAAAATNRTVMAGETPASATFARQAETATAAVQQKADALKLLLEGLGYEDELRLLDQFRGQLEDYRALDRRIHALVLEGSNVKARQLASGPADEAANAVARGVQAAASQAAPANLWQARALGGSVTAAVREIQVLQSRHIPESEMSAMDGFERQMAVAAAAARESLQRLSQISSRDAVAPANAALDRFLSVNAEITQLSRRNTNVHALALALGEHGALSVRCEDGLRALQDALARRGFTGTR